MTNNSEVPVNTRVLGEQRSLDAASYLTMLATTKNLHRSMQSDHRPRRLFYSIAQQTLKLGIIVSYAFELNLLAGLDIDGT